MKRKQKYKDQVLIFDRKKFSNKKKIVLWLKKNNYKIPKNKKEIKKTKKKYVCIQRPCYRFKKTTFKKTKISKGISCIKGLLK